MNLGDLFGVGWNKNEYMYIYTFKSNNQISSTVTTRAGNGMDQNTARYWYPNEKMVVVPVCLNGRRCYSACMGTVSY